MEILDIGGRNYAVGLYWWRALNETDQRYPRRAARRLARDIVRMAEPGATFHDYNLMVIHHTRGLIGLGESDRPVRAIALAVALAEARPEGGVIWYLRIRPDCLIVIATLNGQVLGEGDYVGDETGAARRRAMLIEHYGSLLGEEIAESAVEMAHALLEKLLDLGWARHLPVTESMQRQPRGLWGAGVALIACALAGAGWWMHERWEAKHLIRVRAEIALERSKIRARGRHPLWPQASRALAPDAVLRVCRKSWRKLPLSEEGWMLARFTCTGRRVSQIWRYRPGASFVHLPEDARFLNALGSGAPDEVRVSGVIEPPRFKRALSRELVSRTRAEGLFYRWAREEGIRSLVFTWAAPVRPDPAAPGARFAWAVATWRIEARGVDPFSLGRSLEALPGIEVRKVTAAIASRQLEWSVEGMIYAQE